MQVLLIDETMFTKNRKRSEPIINIIGLFIIVAERGVPAPIIN